MRGGEEEGISQPPHRTQTKSYWPEKQLFATGTVVGRQVCGHWTIYIAIAIAKRRKV
jgi:hypothetical protein